MSRPAADDLDPDPPLTPSGDPLILFSSFAAYFSNFKVDGRSGEGVIEFRVPMSDKAEALRVSDKMGAVGELMFWLTARDAG